jgi:hypothetical protein
MEYPLFQPPYDFKFADGKLWGMAGGEIEYAGQDIITRQDERGRYYKVMRIKLTDHDMQGSPSHAELEPGVHYYLEILIQ